MCAAISDWSAGVKGSRVGSCHTGLLFPHTKLVSELGCQSSWLCMLAVAQLASSCHIMLIMVNTTCLTWYIWLVFAKSLQHLTQAMYVRHLTQPDMPEKMMSCLCPDTPKSAYQSRSDTASSKPPSSAPLKTASKHQSQFFTRGPL